MFVYIVVYASKVLRQKNVTLEKTEQKKIYVMSVLNMIPFPDKKYQIIYADPPWKYQGKMMNSSVTDHYQWADLQDICDLPVKEIADDSCILFMWVTMPKLNEFMEVINAWGFEYKSCAFVWVKQNKKSDSYFMGQGRWTRANPEICVLATKGTPHRISASVRQLVVSPIREHSQKPEEIKNRIIDLVGDLPRIELFARQKTEGWDVWGDSENLK